MKIKIKHLHQHESKKYALKKFLLALFILVAYTIYLIIKFGADGLSLGLITWTAFVLATPIPDGGLILDFPLRILVGIKMVISEIVVWVVAISLNLYFVLNQPWVYEKTIITHVFYQILTNPFFDWSIIAISFLGTFISLYFGDELLDVIFLKDREKYFKHKKWYRIIVAIFLVASFVYLYRYFLALFGLEFNL